MITKERYNQIKERNKDNLMLCYEIFVESQTNQIPFQVFQQAFPQWLVLMQPDVYVMNGGDTNKVIQVGAEKIIKYFDDKFN